MEVDVDARGGGGVAFVELVVGLQGPVGDGQGGVGCESLVKDYLPSVVLGVP